MLTVTAEQLFETFGYTQEEQRTFSYLAEYMSVMRQAWPRLSTDEESLRRFMLAGLYLTYRACRHQGTTMCTQHPPCGEVHRQRLAKWYEWSGEEIESTDQYLWMIGCDGQPSMITRPAPYLVAYVLTGACVETLQDGSLAAAASSAS